ncbi:MAG: class I SAM-dependent methyltransferase [Thermoanaerobaculia bacterium]|nr:class I SAM-dependent methyltransferase [Thermoanaerobaculia bacterium]
MNLTTANIKDFLSHPRLTLRVRRQLMALPSSLVGSIGAGDFKRSGRELCELLQSEGLRSTDRVLDLGCGLGRVAMPLQGVLGHRGSYDGVDVVPEMIAWDTEHITSCSPNFRFHHLDLHNGMYNPNGKLEIADLRFPFDDDSFDLAWATSLFTHLLEADTIAYFHELSRVLRPGAWALATFFLLDDTTRAFMEGGTHQPVFAHRWKRGLIDNPESPEDAVAFELDWVLEQLRSAGLEPRLPHYRGFWCGRPETAEDVGGHRFQDYLIVRKL